MDTLKYQNCKTYQSIFYRFLDFLRFVKDGILAILNSISTKKCNPRPILPTIQVS